MPYTLEAFCADCRRTLADDPGPAGRERVRALLERLIADPEFVASYVGPDAPAGRRTLYEDKDLGFVVLAYVQAEPHRSPPHDHGPSWAVYGQVAEWTDMTEYARTAGEGGGPAALERTSHYRLAPGQAGLYDGSAVHAIDYPAGARFVRVTGTDLDRVARLRYDTAAGRAVVIESASAS